jgi:hypothetical protein
MNQNLTEIVFLLDRSGSMNGLEGDTIGGFNGFVKKQAELGQTNLTTVLFDDRYEILHKGISADGVALSEKEYFTRGNTALLDAVGKTINDVGGRLAKMPEDMRPGKVIFVITTDGYENASREFSYEQVKALITQQTEKYHWEFIFMGVNIDVSAESGKLGIKQDSSFSFVATGIGVSNFFTHFDKRLIRVKAYAVKIIYRVCRYCRCIQSTSLPVKNCCFHRGDCDARLIVRVRALAG